MTDPRQKNVPLTFKERQTLDAAKQLYEEKTGDTGDWGKFLLTVTAAGLAALGIHKLVKANKNRPRVECVYCGAVFPIAYSGELPRVASITCPKCDKELVVDFIEP